MPGARAPSPTSTMRTRRASPSSMVPREPRRSGVEPEELASPTWDAAGSSTGADVEAQGAPQQGEVALRATGGEELKADARTTVAAEPGADVVEHRVAGSGGRIGTRSSGRGTRVSRSPATGPSSRRSSSPDSPSSASTSTRRTPKRCQSSSPLHLFSSRHASSLLTQC